MKELGIDDVPEKNDISDSAEEKLADEILGAPIKKEENATQNPLAARTEQVREKDIPSEQLSVTAKSTKESDVSLEGKAERKPSVRKRLEEIRRARSERAKEKVKAPELAKGTKTKER